MGDKTSKTKYFGYKCAYCNKEYKSRIENNNSNQKEDIVFSTGYCKKCFIEIALPDLIRHNVIRIEDIGGILQKMFGRNVRKSSSSSKSSNNSSESSGVIKTIMIY